MASLSPSSEETNPLLDSSDDASPEDGENGEGTIGNEPPGVMVDEPTTAYLLASLSGVFIGAFVAAADASLIATLSTPISSSFGALSRLAWTASASFIANAAIQPVCGKLTNIYGRKRGLILSNLLFATGNLMCAFAELEWHFVCGRLVAGVGAGATMAIASFTLSDLVPLRRRGVWQGVANSILGVGAACGGVLGGLINDTLGWRAAFMVPIPVTLFAMLLVFFTVRIPTVNPEYQCQLKRIDFLGAIMLCTTLGLILLALTSGGNFVPWTHLLARTPILLSVMSLLLFLFVETKYAVEPIMPFHLLWNRSIAGACFSNAFTCMSRYALLFYLPLFLQVQGYNATEIGIRLIPGSIAVAVASLTCGILIHWSGKYFRYGILSQLINLMGLGLATTFTIFTPAWPPYVAFVLSNLAYGSMLTVTLLAVLSSVEGQCRTVITSILFVFRGTGTVLGIALSSLTFQHVLRFELWGRIGGIEDAAEVITRIVNDLKVIDDLDEELQGQALGAYMSALRAVFLLLVGLGGLSFFAGLFIQDRELPSNVSRR